MRFRRMFSTIDTHTCGDPTRTVIGGVPPIPGDTIAAKMQHLKETRVGDLAAVVTDVTGSAYVTGMHTFVVDPDDPLQKGFSFL